MILDIFMTFVVEFAFGFTIGYFGGLAIKTAYDKFW